MGFRFHKRFGRGPFRFHMTKRGAGASVGMRGLRIGKSADGLFYISFGIPGTGLYYRKTFGQRRWKAPPRR